MSDCISKSMIGNPCRCCERIRESAPTREGGQTKGADHEVKNAAEGTVAPEVAGPVPGQSARNAWLAPEVVKLISAARELAADCSADCAVCETTPHVLGCSLANFEFRLADYDAMSKSADSSCAAPSMPLDEVQGVIDFERKAERERVIAACVKACEALHADSDKWDCATAIRALPFTRPDQEKKP